jgi:hypothetical protein
MKILLDCDWFHSIQLIPINSVKICNNTANIGIKKNFSNCSIEKLVNLRQNLINELSSINSSYKSLSNNYLFLYYMKHVIGGNYRVEFIYIYKT